MRHMHAFLALPFLLTITADPPEPNHPDTLAVNTEPKVTITVKDNEGNLEALLSSPAAEVSLVLLPVLRGLEDGALTIETVLGVLERTYPGIVKVSASALKYALVWCSDIRDFKVVCCSVLHLELSHPLQTLHIVIEEVTPV